MNVSTTDNKFNNCFLPTWLNILYVSVGAIIVFSNVLVTVVIIRTPKLHSIANTFVASLAVADAIIGLVNFLWGVVFLVVTPPDWVFINLDTAFSASSMGTILGAYLHITVIAIDRYLYIVHPFVYFRYAKQQSAIIVLLALWILISLYVLAVAMILNNMSVCSVSDFLETNIVHVDGCISLILFLVTFLAYLRIAALALKHGRSVASVDIVVQSSSTKARQQGNTKGGLSKDSWRHKRKTIRFYLMMTGSIVIMAFPITICNFIAVFHVKIDKNLLYIFFLLPKLQSVFNVFISIFINTDFRRAMHNLFLCRNDG